MRKFALALACVVATALADFDGSFADMYDIETDGDTSDAKRTFYEICEENGFDYEEHKVTTEDGYILTVFRIPGLKAESDDEKNTVKPPVLF